MNERGVNNRLLNNHYDESRKSIRETFKMPVCLELISSNNETRQKVYGYTKNISLSGISLETSTHLNLTDGNEALLYFDNTVLGNPLKLSTKVIWNKDTHYGLEFIGKSELAHEILTVSLRKNVAVNAPINKYYLHINDEDIDTERIEYFAYADKSISEYSKVRDYQAKLKQGEIPDDTSEYFCGQYYIGDSQNNRQAINSAKRAFLQYRKFSIERRRKIMDDIRELLILERENLLRLMIAEGHPRKLAEWEYSGMLTAHLKESLDYYQSELIKTIGKFDNETLISVRRPEGIICVCPPKNAACSNSLIASFALMAGNTLIIKPPINSPISTIYLWRNIVGKALKINGAPRGSINVIVGNSSKFIEEWCQSPDVKAILMFNNSEKGIEIGKKIYESGKKPILELSGNDYMIVWKDSDIHKATDSLLDCFMGSTQICMVPKKALIHSDIYPQFMGLFLEKVKQLKFGLPSEPDTILSPVVKIREFFITLQDAIENGATVLTGGIRVDHRGHKSEHGLYIMPTVIEVPMERSGLMKCINNENFFPLLPIIKIHAGGMTSDEIDSNIFKRMVDQLNTNDYGLRLSVWVKNERYMRKFIEECYQSGMLRINSRHIEFSKCLSTHGGVGLSGGPFGEMNYVWQKSSHLQGISITLN